MKKITLIILMLAPLFGEFFGNINVMIDGQYVGVGAVAVVSNKNSVPYIYFYAPIKKKGDDLTLLFYTYIDTQNEIKQLGQMVDAFVKQVNVLKMKEVCESKVYNITTEITDIPWSVGTFSSEECTFTFGILAEVGGIQYIVSMDADTLHDMIKEIMKMYSIWSDL